VAIERGGVAGQLGRQILPRRVLAALPERLAVGGPALEGGLAGVVPLRRGRRGAIARERPVALRHHHVAALARERGLAAQHDELDLDRVGPADGDAVLAIVLEFHHRAGAVDDQALAGVDGRGDADVEPSARDAHGEGIEELDLGVAVEVDLGAPGEGELHAAPLGAEPIARDERHAPLGGLALPVAIQPGQTVDSGDVRRRVGFPFDLGLGTGSRGVGLRRLGRRRRRRRALPDG
jgi:hypothetical protein